MSELLSRVPLDLDLVAYGFRYDGARQANDDWWGTPRESGETWFSQVQLPFRLRRVLLWPASAANSCALTSLMLGHEEQLSATTLAVDLVAKVSLADFWEMLAPISSMRIAPMPGGRRDFQHCVLKRERGLDDLGGAALLSPACNVGQRIQLSYCGGPLEGLAFVGDAVKS